MQRHHMMVKVSLSTEFRGASFTCKLLKSLMKSFDVFHQVYLATGTLEAVVADKVFLAFMHNFGMCFQIILQILRFRYTKCICIAQTLYYF